MVIAGPQLVLLNIVKMIEICTVGGYSEVGKNCTAIRVDDEIVILDMGLQLDRYIEHTEGIEDDIIDLSAKKLTSIGAIPDLSLIKDWKQNVIAVIPSHAHLDHIGAIPFLSDKFDADIICTPYTKAVLNNILKNDKKRLRNNIISLNPNSSMKLSDKIEVEFIHMTHSVPQTVVIALHTPYGTVLYANDFKLDNNPVLGSKPNYNRLKKLGEEGVLCLIMDSLYSWNVMKTPSENIAKEMVRDVMTNINHDGKAIVITTFSSHLARLKSIVEFGKKLNRKIIFAGRSLSKYVDAGQDIGIIDFRKDVEIIKYKTQIKKKFKKIEKNKDKFIIVCTGHQGEKKAVLSSIVDKVTPFKLENGDHVIFSCTVIPAEVNKKNRNELEKKLMARGVRIFRDIHVSGHASREDHRELIEMVKPKHLIPAHGDAKVTNPLMELAQTIGYKKNKTVHQMHDGKRLKLH